MVLSADGLPSGRVPPHPPPASPRAARQWVAVVALYVAVVLLLMAPVSNYQDFGSAIQPGDPTLLAWTFAWTNHAILTGRPLFEANIFFPASSALTYAEHHIGVGIWGLPLYAVTGNAVLVYSVLQIVALAFNGVAMHVFVWRWRRSHVLAFAAGLVFAVSAPRVLYAGHLPIHWNGWMPLLLLALDRWLTTRRAAWAAVAAVLFALQALATWYLAVMTALAALLLVPRHLLWQPPPVQAARRLVLQAVGGMLIAAALIWPFASPSLQLMQQEEVTESLAARFSADVGSYIQPHENALAGPLITRLTGLQTRRVGAERAQFLGLLTIALAAIGAGRVVWLWLRRARLRWSRGSVGMSSPQTAGDSSEALDRLWGGYCLLLSGTALVLSFGPAASGSSPFELLMALPAVNLLRVPSRFAVLVLLGTAGLVALGLAQIRRIGRRAGTAAAIGLILVMPLEWAVVPPAYSRPRALSIPEIYETVADLDVRALVSLPCYRRTGPTWPLDADYMLYSTLHWRPIVNGYGRAEPAGLHWVVGSVNAFPGANSAMRMRTLGIDHVVLHTDRYPDGAGAILAEALRSRDFHLIARRRNDYLFKVLPGPHWIQRPK